MNTKLSIPNSFYDLIVFLTPTSIFMIIILANFDNYIDYYSEMEKVSFGNLFVASVILLTLSYEYGRAIEAWSSYFVQKPIFWLQNTIGWPKNDNFGWAPNSNDLGMKYGLEHKQAKNRWTYYYVAALVDKEIGSDLLKRYAWEKLSRSSALNYMILAAVSAVTYSLTLIGVINPPRSPLGIGQPAFTVLMSLMSIACASEYYFRCNWNMDLLIKITPVLKTAVDANYNERRE